MVREKKLVKVQLRDGAIKETEVEFFAEPPWGLALSGLSLPVLEFSGSDLFEAQIALRLQLENIDARLLCAGARTDVFPSGMSRDMGGGRKAYITRIGAPSSRADLVDIFDFAEPKTIGSVEEQKAFHEKWAESLRR